MTYFECFMATLPRLDSNEINKLCLFLNRMELFCKNEHIKQEVSQVNLEFSRYISMNLSSI